MDSEFTITFGNSYAKAIKLPTDLKLTAAFFGRGLHGFGLPRSQP